MTTTQPARQLPVSRKKGLMRRLHAAIQAEAATRNETTARKLQLKALRILRSGRTPTVYFGGNPD